MPPPAQSSRTSKLWPVTSGVDLRERMQRFSVRAAADIAARYPGHCGTRVTLALPGGRTLHHEVQDSLGDPERALSPAAVLEKAGSLMAYGGVSESGFARRSMPRPLCSIRTTRRRFQMRCCSACFDVRKKPDIRPLSNASRVGTVRPFIEIFKRCP